MTAALADPLLQLGLASGSTFPLPPPVPINPATLDLAVAAPIATPQPFPICAPSCAALHSAGGYMSGMFAADPDGRRVYHSVVRAGAGLIVEGRIVERDYPRRVAVADAKDIVIAAHPLRPRIFGVGEPAAGIYQDPTRKLVIVDTDTFEVVSSVSLPIVDPTATYAGWYSAPVFSPDGSELFVLVATRLYKLDADDGHVIGFRELSKPFAPRMDRWRSWIWGISDNRIVALRSDTFEQVVDFTREGILWDLAIVADGNVVFSWQPWDMAGAPWLLELADASGKRIVAVEDASVSRFLENAPSKFVYREGRYGDRPLVERDAASLQVRQQRSLETRTIIASAFVPEPAVAVEFHHAGFDHYFLTSDPEEIVALDRGALSGWQRTGETFKIMRSDAGTHAADIPVCRFYGQPSHGLDSHFYTASRAECDAVEAGYGGAWLKERADAFYVVRPNEATGACPAGTLPVYRLWNARFDSNHRYTTSAATKADMVARGYVPEGYGPERVAWCVRQ